ncbi:MAG TPA: ABC transporter substrate-binding protein [Rhodopila sp.]|jgi:ABC-type nitrate/sulfonate/bicarbonate transport system substrate-binding protein
MTEQRNTVISRRAALAGLAGASGAALGLPGIPKAGAGDLKTLRVFFPPIDFGWSVGFELIELADAKGIFTRNGVRIERAVVPWDQYTVGLDTGALDLAPFADYAYFINVYDKGLKAKEIVSSTLPFSPLNHGDGLVVLADGPIRTPQDLKGKRIGTQFPSFSGVWFALDWLRKRGVTKDDVAIVPVPEAQLEQVLKAGGVEAIIAYSPLDIQLQRKGGFRQLFSVSDIAGRFITRGGTMATDKFIGDHPDAVRGYVASIAEAADYANANPAEPIKIGLERGHLDKQYLPDLYNREGKDDYSHLRWAPHGLNNADDLAFWLKLVEDADIVPRGKHKPTDFFTNAFNPFATA